MTCDFSVAQLRYMPLPIIACCSVISCERRLCFRTHNLSVLFPVIAIAAGDLPGAQVQTGMHQVALLTLLQPTIL